MHKSENQTSMTNMARLETQISWISSGNSVFQLFGPRLYESCVVDFWWLECFTIPSATGGGAYERGRGNFPLPEPCRKEGRERERDAQQRQENRQGSQDGAAKPAAAPSR